MTLITSNYFNLFRWEGEGVNEVGVDKCTREVRITVDPKYYRPAEVDLLLGDPSKAKRILGWEPKITFEVKPLPPFIINTNLYLNSATL